MTSQHTQVADRMRDAHPAGLAGRVALMTGGSGGIGPALVRRLAVEGTAVAVACSAPRRRRRKTSAQAAAEAASGASAVFGISVPFGPGGLVQEVAQGKLLIEVAADLGLHLVFSSVRGADRNTPAASRTPPVSS